MANPPGSTAIPKSARLVYSHTNMMILVKGEHFWIKTRGDTLMGTIRRRNNYQIHLRAKDFEVKTNGAPIQKNS